MFTLKSRTDNFRCTLPKDFLTEKITEKYGKYIAKKHSFIMNPIDFLNETIQGVAILGFTQASIIQQQQGRSNYASNNRMISRNLMPHDATEYAYRSEKNPLALIDKTLRLTFRHTLGYINYFMLLENFWELYSRDTPYSKMPEYITIDLFDEIGCIISKINVYSPIIESLDMLTFNYTAPIAQSQTFNCEIKYSNIDFEFVEQEEKTKEYYERQVVEPLTINKSF